MNEKLNLKKGALAGGLTGSALYIICGIAYSILPNEAIAFAKSLFHAGIEIQIAPITATGFIAGIISSFITGFIIVGLFILFYNYLKIKNK